MSAGATPTKGDPKRLITPTTVSSAPAAYYVAPAGERGVRLTGIVVLNNGSTNVTVTIWIVESGGSRGNSNLIANAIPVPADGSAIVVPGSDREIMNAVDSIHAQSSITQQVTMRISGIEMDD